MHRFKEIKVGNISPDDVIIALMGPTGTGKSTFINIATLQNGSTIGHTLESRTSTVRAVRFLHPEDQRPFVFLDTPGFNDTNKSDTEVLSLIAEWLAKTYKNQVKLAGIVYLHRISDNRMAGSPLKNLNMFAKLCGDAAIQHVVLATTMWSRVKEDVGAKREKELRDKYWNAMLQGGSRAMRFHGSFKSAWDIINEVTKPSTTTHALLLQEELVDLHRRLSETSAGITLYNELQKLLTEQKDTIRKLRDEAMAENDEQLVQELTIQYRLMQENLQNTFDQLTKMKIPLGRRIAALFSFRKTHSRAIAIK